MGNRKAALDILVSLKKKLLSNRVLKYEYGMYLEGLANNLGVILRRNGQIKEAQDQFKLAIQIQSQVRVDDDESTQPITFMNSTNIRESISRVTMQNEEIREQQFQNKTTKNELNHEGPQSNNISVFDGTTLGNQTTSELFYRQKLIRFFPVYNLGVTHSKAHRYDEALEIFKDSLKLLFKMQGYQSQPSVPSVNSEDQMSPIQIYFINVYSNLALIYEKKLQFQNALFCLDKACLNHNEVLLAMKDRMLKIVNALKNNIINIDKFDQTYVNEHETNPHLIIDEELQKINRNDYDVGNEANQMTQQITKRKSSAFDEQNLMRLSFDKAIYQLENKQTNIQSTSIPSQSVQHQRGHSQPRFNANLSSSFNFSRGLRGSRHFVNQIYSKKQKSKQDSEPLFGFNNKNDDSIKFDIKMKRSYFRKGNTANIPENLKANQLFTSKFSQNRTLSDDDCIIKSMNTSKLRSVNDRQENPKNNPRYDLIYSLENSPEFSPLRDLSPNIGIINQKNSQVEEKNRQKMNMLSQVKIQNLRPLKLHHYKGDPREVVSQAANSSYPQVNSNKYYYPDAVASNVPKSSINKMNQIHSNPIHRSIKFGQESLDFQIKQSRYIMTQDITQIPNSKGIQVDQSEGNDHGISNQNYLAKSVDNTRVYKVQSEPRLQPGQHVVSPDTHIQLSQKQNHSLYNHNNKITDYEEQIQLSQKIKLPAANASGPQQIIRSKNNQIRAPFENIKIQDTNQCDFLADSRDMVPYNEYLSKNKTYNQKRMKNHYVQMTTSYKDSYRAIESLQPTSNKNNSINIDNNQDTIITDEQLAASGDYPVKTDVKSETTSPYQKAVLTKPELAQFDISTKNAANIAKKLTNRVENTSYTSHQSRQQNKQKTLMEKVSEGHKNTISRSEKKSVASFEIKRNTTSTMIKQTLLSKPVLQDKHKNSLNNNDLFENPPLETQINQNLQVEVQNKLQISDDIAQNDVKSQKNQKMFQINTKQSTKNLLNSPNSDQYSHKNSVKSPKSDELSNKNIEIPPVPSNDQAKQKQSLGSSQKIQRTQKKQLTENIFNKTSIDLSSKVAPQENLATQEVAKRKTSTDEVKAEPQFLKAQHEKFEKTNKMVKDGHIKEAVVSYNEILKELRKALKQRVTKKIKNAQIEQQQRTLEQKVVILLAELYYKIKDYKKGMESINSIFKNQENLDQKQIIHILTVKGKLMDIKGEYIQAAKVYEQTLNDYDKFIQKNQINSQQSEILKEYANIQFRLGWAQIRSKKDVEKGINQLKQAEKNLPENEDLKIKLAQTLFQEQLKIAEAHQLLEEVLKQNDQNYEALYLQGKIYMKQKQFKEAEKRIQKSIDIQRKLQIQIRSGYMFHLGQCQELHGDFKKAIVSFQESLELNPRHFGSLVHLSNLYLSYGDNSNAAKFLQTAHQIDPESVVVNFCLGKLYFDEYQKDKKDNYQKVTHYFQKVLDKKSDHYRTLYFLGKLHFEEGNLELAQQYLHRSLPFLHSFPAISNQTSEEIQHAPPAINLSQSGSIPLGQWETSSVPDSSSFPRSGLPNWFVPALVCIGNLLFEGRQSEQALQMHQKALQLQSDNIEGLIGVANCLYDLRRLREAATYYEKALDVQNTKPDQNKLPGPPGDVYYNLGNVYNSLRETDKAIWYYMKSVDLNSNRSECLYNLGNSLFNKLRYEDARNSFIRALECFDNTKEFLLKTQPAFVQEASNDKKEVAEPTHSQEKLEEPPLEVPEIDDLTRHQIDIFQNLANTEQILEKYQEAIQRYEVVLRYINNESLHMSSQKSQAEQRNSIESFSFNKFDKNKEMRLRLMFNLATCNMHMNNCERSQHYYEECLKINNKNVDYILGLAKVYQKMHKYRKAIEMYEEANKLLPDEPEKKSDDKSSHKSVSTSQRSRRHRDKHSSVHRSAFKPDSRRNKSNQQIKVSQL